MKEYYQTKYRQHVIFGVKMEKCYGVIFVDDCPCFSLYHVRVTFNSCSSGFPFNICCKNELSCQQSPGIVGDPLRDKTKLKEKPFV